MQPPGNDFRFRDSRMDDILHLYNEDGSVNKPKCVKCLAWTQTCTEVVLIVAMPVLFAGAASVGTACAIDTARFYPTNYAGIASCSALAIFGGALFTCSSKKIVKKICWLRRQRINNQNLLAAAASDNNL